MNPKLSSPLRKVPIIHEVIIEEPDSSRSKPRAFFSEFNDIGKINQNLNPSSNHYFSCDSPMDFKNPKKIDQVQFSQIGENETIFNKTYFFEFLAYQIIFFFFLGPFLAGFLYLLNRSSALSRNQHFWGLSSIFFIQTFQYVITVTSFCLFYLFKPASIEPIEIYMLVIHLVIYFCIKAISFATINHHKMEFFKNRRLNEIEYASEFMMGLCVEQKRFDIEKELQATILRKEIDIGLFGFRFITSMSQKYNQILRDEGEEELGADILHLQGTKIGKQAEELRKKVKQCNGEVYSGFNLAGLLLKQNQLHLYSKRTISIVAGLFGLTTGVLPNLFRAQRNGTCFGETSVENYMIVSLFFGTVIFVYFNCLFLLNSIFEYDQVFQYLSQMSNLLSSRRLNLYYSRKYLPTIDFFEPFTFKSWGILHRVLRNYGKKQKTRVDYQLSIFLIAAILFVVWLVLSVFDYLGTFSAINISVLLYQTLTILIVLLLILKKGMAINKLYALHITILKHNKNILSDLLRLNEIYFNDKFVPENEIYRQGIEVLRRLSDSMIRENYFFGQKELGENKQSLVIRKILKNLIKISDDIVEELRMSLENEPFSVLSIPATEDLLHSVAMIIASGLVTILKKLLIK